MTAPSRSVIFLLGMPIVGIILCGFWFLLIKRSFAYYIYWILPAREIEERHLSGSVQTIFHGSNFAEGKQVEVEVGGKKKQFQMSRWGRLLRVERSSYFIIGLFFSMYAVILTMNIMN